MQIKKSELFFNYHEHSRVHNPYELEARTMEGIRKGDVERVIKSLDETFTGEYGILSKSSLQSAKNLGIIGLTLASRAAIGGGMPYEKAFSLHDSQVLRLEEINNIGEVEVMIRQSKIQYAEMVHELRSGCDRKKNLLIEECKNLIFRKMHTKIIIRELADELEVSVEYLSALFRKTEGICIKDYITKEKTRDFRWVDAGFKLYRTLIRYTNPNWSDEDRPKSKRALFLEKFYDETIGEFATPADAEELYELLYKLNNGYIQTVNDRNNHADFISFINRILLTGSLAKNISIVSEKGKKAVISQDMFGYRFKVVK